MTKQPHTLLILLVLTVAACSILPTSNKDRVIQPGYLSAQGLIDSPVNDREGRLAGVIQDIVINQEAGKIDYVILKLEDPYLFGRGDVLPSNQKLVALPWRMISIDAGNTGAPLVVQSDLQRLYSAPRIEPGKTGLQPGCNTSIDIYWSQGN